MPHISNSPEWGWWIVFYFFFGGIAAGAYFAAALLELVGEPQDRAAMRIAHLVAFPLLALCGLLLIVDLNRPERFWHMLVANQTGLPFLKAWSPMSLGSWGLMLFSGLALVSFVDALLERSRGRAVVHRGSLGKVWSLLGSVLGFFFASYTGVLLNTTSYPGWSQSPWIGALFMASSASTGMAAILLLLRLGRRYPVGTAHKLEEADSYAMGLELVLIVAFVATLGALAYPFIGNPVGAVLLWGGVVLAGLIVPLLLHRLKPSGLGAAGATLALVLTLAGGFILRYVVVMVPQGVFG